MNSRHYLPGEMYGIESARRRGYVATSRFDDDLAIDWYGICEDEGLPFVQCARRQKYHVVDYDLTPFLRVRPELVALSDGGLEKIISIASQACRVSPSNAARFQAHDRGGMIQSIPHAQAHRLAQRLARVLRDMSMYRGDVAS